MTISFISNAQSYNTDDSAELDDGATGMEELAANSAAVLEERELQASQKTDDMVLDAVDQEATLYRGKHEKTKKVYVIKCTDKPIEIDLEETLTQDLNLDSADMSKLELAIKKAMDEINQEIDALEHLIETHLKTKEARDETEDSI